MGGIGGDFILESGNDCNGQREKDRRRREREREEEEMQTKRRTKEGNKQRKTEKRKT